MAIFMQIFSSSFSTSLPLAPQLTHICLEAKKHSKFRARSRLNHFTVRFQQHRIQFFSCVLLLAFRKLTKADGARRRNEDDETGCVCSLVWMWILKYVNMARKSDQGIERRRWMGKSKHNTSFQCFTWIYTNTEFIMTFSRCSLIWFFITISLASHTPLNFSPLTPHYALFLFLCMQRRRWRKISLNYSEFNMLRAANIKKIPQLLNSLPPLRQVVRAPLQSFPIILLHRQARQCAMNTSQEFIMSPWIALNHWRPRL